MLHYSCEESEGKTLDRIERNIKTYIKINQDELAASIPKYKPFLKWLREQNCITAVVPPKAIIETLPAYYSIFVKVIINTEELWYNLNMQEGKISKRIFFRTKSNSNVFAFRYLQACSKEEITRLTNQLSN